MSEMFSTHCVAFGTPVAQRVVTSSRLEADCLFRDGDDVLAHVQTALDRRVPFGAIARCQGFEGGSRRVDGPAYAALAEARRMYGLSAGAFDATIAPVADLWRRCRASGHVPTSAAIENAMRVVDGSKLMVGDDGRSVRLGVGQSVALGGLARGFAADRLIEAYRHAGVSTAFVNVGGRIRILGRRAGNRPWTVAIPDPYEVPPAVMRFMGVRSESSVCSGRSELPIRSESPVRSGPRTDRSQVRGRLASIELSRIGSGPTSTDRAHRPDDGVAVVTREAVSAGRDANGIPIPGATLVIDPRTGLPVSGDLAAVTIVASGACFADALALAVLVLGFEEGMQLVDSLPGVEAMVITCHRLVVTTPALSPFCHSAQGVRPERFRVWG